MATFSVSNSNGRFSLRLTLTEGTGNVSTNTSPVTYKLDLIANTSYHFIAYAIGYAVTLDGTTVASQSRATGKQYDLDSYGTLTLCSGTTTITHNADGSKSLSVAYSIDMASLDYTPGPLSGTGTMTLATINRGLVYIDDGSGFVKYQCYIDNGTSWDQYMPYIDNGSGWDLYT